MVTILELELPIEEFALNKTLTTVSEAHIEIERVVADDSDRITPYIWVRTDDFDAFEAALDDDPTVKDVTELAETDDERSYQMTWIESIDLILQLLTDHEGTVTHAEGSADGWHLRVVFPDHDHSHRRTTLSERTGFGLRCERSMMQTIPGILNMDSQRPNITRW